MSDPQNRPDSGQSAGTDPFSGFASSVRDMWVRSIPGMGSFLPQGGAENASGSSAPFDQMLRAFSAFQDSAQGNIKAFSGSEGFGGPADTFSSMARAYTIAGVSGLRYWSRLAQIYGAHQAGLPQSLFADASNRGHPTAERRTFAEEFRAYLREIGDASVQEARKFQSELEKLATDVATAAGSADNPIQYQRRWRAKP